MIYWWILIIGVLLAVIIFAAKYSSRIGNELTTRNSELEKKNAITRGMDYKTYVKDGIIAMDDAEKKIVYVKDIGESYIVREFPFSNVHTIELLIDDEVLFKKRISPKQFDENTIKEIDEVYERHLEKYKILRGDIISINLRIGVNNANNPIYSFNFYTKNVIANKALLDLAIRTAEAWAIKLIRYTEA